MIIDFAREKGMKLDAPPSEVIDYINSIVAYDMDIEMTQEMLENVSGGMVVNAPSLRGVKNFSFLRNNIKTCQVC